MRYRYAVSQRCEENNNHNKVLGVIFEESSDRACIEQELIRNTVSCAKCRFHSSIIKDDHLVILPYINCKQRKETFFQGRMISIVVSCLIFISIALTAYIYIANPDDLFSKRHLQYLLLIGVSIVAFSAVDDSNTTKLNKLANLFVALFTAVLFVITFES